MLIVEMALIDTSGYLDMQVKTWRALLNLAKNFGWQPEGTQPNRGAAVRDPEYLSYFENSYEVREYAKNFSASDALSLSKALMTAYALKKSGKVCLIEIKEPVWLKDDMDQQDFDQINASLEVGMLRLSEFAAKGEFLFSWDD
jgi:hypothetical protein